MYMYLIIVIKCLKNHVISLVFTNYILKYKINLDFKNLIEYLVNSIFILLSNEDFWIEKTKKFLNHYLKNIKLFIL